MLRALLHQKLGRAAAKPEDIAEAESPSWEGITSLEDPLTSAVFERLAYLEPSTAWGLLRHACETLHGPALPETAPEGTPDWSFWPKLKVGVEGLNARYVEPDVVLSWGNVVLVFEAKHRGAQSAAQWIEEIRAVRAAPWFNAGQLWLVGVGGLNPGGLSGCAEEVCRELGGEAPALLALRWDALREAAREQRGRARSPGEAELLKDIEAALELWGYRRRFGFDSLPRFAAAFPVTTTTAALRQWRVR